MSYRIIHDDIPRVTDFVGRKLEANGILAQAAIGVERNGELVGGVLYDSFNGANICAHIAGTPGVRWFTKSFGWFVTAYPFVQLQCRRITASIHSKNQASINFVEHFGFEHEATLREAALDGDLLLYVLWEHRCKWHKLKGVDHGIER